VKFWILWGWDAIISAIFLVFFFWGLADGTVSSFNIVLWAGILFVLAAIMGGSLWLRSIKQTLAAVLTLLVIAIPSLLAALLLLLVLILQPRWN